MHNRNWRMARAERIKRLRECVAHTRAGPPGRLGRNWAFDLRDVLEEPPGYGTHRDVVPSRLKEKY